MKCPDCGKEIQCPGEVIVPPVLPPTNSPWPGYELWVDIYQRNGEHNFPLMLDNGVTGFCGKIGYGYTNKKAGDRGCEKDVLFISNGEKVLKAGGKYSAYWWTHPLEDLNRQVRTILEMTKNLDLSWIANDMEQHDGYGWEWDKKKKKFLWEHVQKIGADKIDHAGKFITLEMDRLFDIPVLVYTRNSFIDEFDPDMVLWMKDYDYWVSQLPFEHVFTCDKAEAEAKGFTYCATWKEYFDNYASKPDTKVTLPKGIKDWKIRQFSYDKVKLPGSTSFMDLNWLKV